MPFVTLPRSPVAPEVAPARVHVREAGAGRALLLLHGGWGYEAYPFDAAIAALAPARRVVAPDRVGYGRSSRPARVPPRTLPRGFHRLMADETLLVMDALGIERAAVWGHSDGAVIAAWMALLAPARIDAVILEAFHFFAAKVRSIEFFENAVGAPERFGDAVVTAVQRDHGDDWREVLAAGGRAWLQIIREGELGRRELFDGRLGEVRAPVLFLHGRHDPRTEPGELEAAAREIPGARVELLAAAHGPHASRTAGARCVAAAAEFLAAIPA